MNKNYNQGDAEADPINDYLHVKGVNTSVIVERVRAKAYHKMRNHCLNDLGWEAAESAEAARTAGKYHVDRYKSHVGV